VIALIPWTHREFNFDLPLGLFPAIVERLRGTPARASEIIAGVPDEVLGNRINGKWAAKEHLGHLVDFGRARPHAITGILETRCDAVARRYA
jgi:hypothetical protein